MTNKTLQYRFDGPEDAPILILGPALGTTWHMWDRQLPGLTRHWRVLRYDLPGHGGAPAEPATSVADLADRLLATLDALGIDRFGYAGCSIGAAVGVRIALVRPDRIAALALVSAAARHGTADAWRQRGVVVRANGLGQVAHTVPERWFTDGFRSAQAGIVEWAVQMVRTTDADCYIAACEALAAHDVRDELGRIAVPTLVVAGADDPATPPADARVLVAGIPDAKLAVVPAASHLTPVEQPAAVGELLVRHFSTAWSDQAVASTTAVLTAPAAPPAAEQPAAVPEVRPDPYDEGLRIRREVLGDAHVDRAADRADDFTGEFQEFITRYAWGEVWARPGLDRRTRSIITLTALTAGGHLKELAFHTRAALRNGLTPAEIKEALLHTAVYCGVPAANSAFAVAQRVIQEETSVARPAGEPPR
ncbi:4-carboxymuconolactone decarboxylase [Streptomyces sp. H10-C2]|uniref:bifunctional 3-oxoadipate enol-lactonase/4-carboxymuconolactone decarboxylase PcaDC n=1 Tax=unclassified Streptomyces TaxID=2593676 RepID=UPI0024B91671|nr:MULTISPECIES: 4-carboxymuconolactone decarboxylase [unclassified Streptomyces]MDJ0340823.1 4-carboxymuconolactone decarboxylase [Streptomyces sp. PH10-H1]MDJ0371663.1 4-carboxymuconolactone decarboxylase [Streptomyces sp. H10-C2]